MSKVTKIWIVVAASALVLGIIVFGGAMTMLKWDFTRLSTVKYEINRYDIGEEYHGISIVTDTADIVLVPTDNARTEVECYEQKNVRHAVAVREGTLEISVQDTRKWYEYIGLNFHSPKITVYLPKGAYGALQIRSDTGDVEIPKEFTFESIDISEKTGDVACFAGADKGICIQTTTGKIHVQDITASSLELSVSTGKVTAARVMCTGDVSICVSTGKAQLRDLTCQSLTSSGNTGDISLQNVTAVQALTIERTTGDVELEGCDAAELFIKTDTGDVEGWLRTDKVFIAKTDTGRIDVPSSITGGRCEITTDTGDIKLRVGA